MHGLGRDNVHQHERDGAREERMANIPPKDEHHEEDADDSGKGVPVCHGGGFCGVRLALVGVRGDGLEDKAERNRDKQRDCVACFARNIILV